MLNKAVPTDRCPVQGGLFRVLQRITTRKMSSNTTWGSLSKVLSGGAYVLFYLLSVVASYVASVSQTTDSHTTSV